MADAREQAVWTEHANKDHIEAIPYTEDPQINKLFEHLKDIKTVVDIGCGSGLWRNIFKDYCYIGIDQNEAMLKAARIHFPEAHFCWDIDQVHSSKWNGFDTMFILHNARDSFNQLFQYLPQPDLVWCSAVLQHNRHLPDKDEFVRNVHSLLKPNTYWMFTEVTFSLEADNYHHVFKEYKEDMTDGNSFTRTGWIDFMQSRGFEIVDTARHDYYLFRRI